MKKVLLIVLLSSLLLTGCGNVKEENKAYYEFGMPTEESQTNYKKIEEEKNSIIFVKLENDLLSVCVDDNGLYCIKNNNYEEEKSKLLNKFGEEKCKTNENEVNFEYLGEVYTCEDDDIIYIIYKNGKTYISQIEEETDSEKYCLVYDNNEVICENI